MRPYNRTTNTTDKVLILNWDMYSDENALAGQVASFGCIVVITSALHAEGRGFDPRPEYYYRTRVFLFRKHEPFRNSLKILNSYKKGFKTQNIEAQEKLLRSYYTGYIWPNISGMLAPDINCSFEPIFILSCPIHFPRGASPSVLTASPYNDNNLSLTIWENLVPKQKQ